MMELSRRTLFAGAGAATAFSMMPRLALGSAAAAQTSGYRALVCLFLFGGMDGHDLLLPVDQTSFDQLREARRPLIDAYGRQAAGARRTPAELLELSPANASAFGDRRFGLPREMAGVHGLFERGVASVVANVGPLIEPMSRIQFESRVGVRPKSLFSHNDQQSTWMAMSPEGARFGWGGQFADHVIAANANVEPNFTAISVSGQSVFLSGVATQGFQMTNNGSQTIRELDRANILGPGKNSTVAQGLLESHFRADGATRRNLFERDVARLAQRSVDVNARFNAAFSDEQGLLTAFPETRLGGQLGAIARTIRARGVMGASRQVFFVGMGGFDTHSGQANALPRMQQEISDAVTAFYAATEELGVADQVTLFTASDFGRTLTANGDGTDHGWGNHHLVVGGGINGGHIFGDVPPPTFDHDWDSGRGRLIPSTSVEQFAAPLGRWFGLNDTELAMVFPRLNRFTGALPLA